jgi:hypothetical protein
MLIHLRQGHADQTRCGLRRIWSWKKQRLAWALQYSHKWEEVNCPECLKLKNEGKRRRKDARRETLDTVSTNGTRETVS